MLLQSSGRYEMSGKRYLLDTNAIIQLLQGNLQLSEWLLDADFIAISVISYLEFISFKEVTQQDKALLQQFMERVEIVNLHAEDRSLIDTVAEIRVQTRLKLPDAVILASAFTREATLITADKQLANQTWVLTRLFIPEIRWA